MRNNLRLLYLYLFSFIGLLVVVIGSIQMVNLGLKVAFFKDADRFYVAPVMPVPSMNEKVTTVESKEEVERRQETETFRQRQRDFVEAFSMIVVGLPLYIHHWTIIKKEA